MLGAVAEILRARGSEGWLVGGSVRDRLLGESSPDLDVVVSDDAERVAEQLASALRAPWFSLSERYPTYRVLGREGHVDLTCVRGSDILDDLAERDFTINAMAVPVAAIAATASVKGGAGEDAAGLLGGDNLLDPFDGAIHLREKRLSAVSDHIFADDALRLMRAARFCHTLELEPDSELLRMIEEQVTGLGETAAERVVNEMRITLAAGRAAAAVRLWKRLGLLAVVLPEAMKPEQAWKAKLTSLDRLDALLDDPVAWFPEHADLLLERVNEPVDGVVTKSVALRLAGLMQGLSVAEMHEIGHRLRLSSALVSLLIATARCLGAGRAGVGASGVAPVFGDVLPDGATVSREAVLFLWDAAPWEPEVVLLGATTDGASTDREARRLMALAAERARGELAACPVDGEILMRELGMESGPALGRALREARLAWESGEATAEAELIKVARLASLDE